MYVEYQSTDSIATNTLRKDFHLYFEKLYTFELEGIVIEENQKERLIILIHHFPFIIVKCFGYAELTLARWWTQNYY